MATLKLVPENDRTTRVYIVEPGGREIDISNLISTVTWTHHAGHPPVCTLRIIAVEPEDILTIGGLMATGTITATAVSTPDCEPPPNSDRVDVTSLSDRVRRLVPRLFPRQ